MRIKEQFIHEPNPIILGLSLGGMLAVEIAKANPTAKVIVISSAKTKKEIPLFLRMFRYAPVYKILPVRLVRRSSHIQQYFLGVTSDTTKKYLKNVLQQMDIEFYRWSVHALLTWDNVIMPSNVVHIHGTSDHLRPYNNVTADIAIENGGHLMIVENAEDISLHLKNILCKS